VAVDGGSGDAEQGGDQACRQAAYRRRHTPTLAHPALAPPPGDPGGATIYTCPTCQQRFLGEQRCRDSNIFAARLGTGGSCPDCDTLLTIDPGCTAEYLI
jgi:hypothetical protein